jgi:hypothetical protein
MKHSAIRKSCAVRKKTARKKRDEAFYSLYSDDDGVVLFDNERDALAARRRWLRAGANGVHGPFIHYKTNMEKALPLLLNAARAVVKRWEKGDLAGAVRMLQKALDVADGKAGEKTGKS